MLDKEFSRRRPSRAKEPNIMTRVSSATPSLSLHPARQKRELREKMARAAGRLSWRRKFSAPISVGDTTLHSLRDGADYILELPRWVSNQEHWRTAISCLIDAAEHNGIVMMAQLALLQAIHREAPRSRSTERRRPRNCHRTFR